ncbi:unnamed protein product, partial [Medioppia subpectinata]
MDDNNEDINEDSDESYGKELNEEMTESTDNVNRNARKIQRVMKWDSKQSFSHVRTHENRRIRYRCEYKECHKTFLSRPGLKKHSMTHITQSTSTPIVKKFKCHYSECQKRFARKEGLTEHLERHSSERSYRCDFIGCGKCFKTLNDLRRHSLVHKTGPTLSCDVDRCVDMFYTEYHRSLHHKSVHNYCPKESAVCVEKRPVFRCDVIDCGKTLKSKLSLEKHIQNMHVSGPTVKCGIDGCTDMFTNEHQKRKHQTLVHNREPLAYKRLQHRCDWPGCEWTGRGITEHKRSHTGEKRYQCLWPDCGKQFRKSCHLTNHMNVHNNVRPYACHWPG